MANVYRPDFDDASDREGFRLRGARVGRQAGAERLGASVYELPPGEASFPYHCHLANEEMLIVLKGSPTLRTPEGWRELDEGELVAFPAGERGGHQVVNRTDEPVRILMLSTMRAPEVAIYLDTGKVMAREQPPGTPPTGYRKIFKESSEVDYWDGETPPAPPS